MGKFFNSLLILSLFFLFTGCSPCHRIQRLATKHPECFKALNETKTDTGGVKVASRDSATRANDKAIDGARDTFIKYLTVIQDCNSTREQKEKAVTRVNDALTRAKETTRANTESIPCLTDTVTFHPKDGYTLKLWQQGHDIKYSLSYPSVTYKLSEKSWPWWTWLLIGVFGGIILSVVLVRMGRTG